MIEFGKITGSMEGHYIQVRLRTQECLYAPMITFGNSVSIPSEQWITENKDNFLAVVAFEKDLLQNPMIVGFFPVKGATSEVYNTHEQLLQVVTDLVEELTKARVNTQIGPQKFMPDTQIELEKFKSKLGVIKSKINNLKL